MIQGTTTGDNTDKICAHRFFGKQRRFLCLKLVKTERESLLQILLLKILRNIF